MYSMYCNIGMANLYLCWNVTAVGMDDTRCSE
jgi:hypothetical protein